METRSAATPAARAQRGGQGAAPGVLRGIATTAAALCLVAVVAVLGLVGSQALFDRTIAIEPLAVPASLAATGFSGDVASTRLADDINGLTLEAQAANDRRVADHPKPPLELVLPVHGLSVQALAAKLGTYFGLKRQQVVSGEFTIAGDRLFLRLKLNDRPILSTARAVAPREAGAMLDEAARAVLKQTEPYLFATTEYSASQVATGTADDKDAHQAKALAAVDELLAALPEGDGQLKYAHLLKGTILRDDGRRAEARAEFETALKIDPHFAAAFADLGALEAEAGDANKALAAYDAALQVKPALAAARMGKAATLVRLGRDEAAIAAYEAALALTPDAAPAHEQLGALLLKQKACAAARAQFEAAARLDPASVGAQTSLRAIDAGRC